MIDVSPRGPAGRGQAGLFGLESGVPIVVLERPDSATTPSERISKEAAREMPGLSVSFAVHVCLFLLLAIWSLGDGVDDDRIVLEVSPMGEDIESREMDLEIGGGSKSEAEAEDANESMAETEEEQVEVPLDPTELDTAEMAMKEELSETGSADLDGSDQNEGSVNDGASEGAGEGTGTEFFGAKTSGSRFVFVVDCSGSMDTDGRWGRAVGQLMSAIDGLSEKQDFLVFLYHSDTVAMLHMDSETADLIPATEENKAKFAEWMKMQRPVGRTRPSASMRRALETRPDAIFFLSDGEFKDDTVEMIHDCNVAHSTGGGKRRKTSIHTFFLGTDADRATMEEIADQNNGIFTWVQ